MVAASLTVAPRQNWLCCEIDPDHRLRVLAMGLSRDISLEKPRDALRDLYVGSSQSSARHCSTESNRGGRSPSTDPEGSTGYKDSPALVFSDFGDSAVAIIVANLQRRHRRRLR
eukprot:2254420-Prymnesium_polylepis.1